MGRGPLSEQVWSNPSFRPCNLPSAQCTRHTMYNHASDTAALLHAPGDRRNGCGQRLRVYRRCLRAPSGDSDKFHCQRYRPGASPCKVQGYQMCSSRSEEHTSELQSHLNLVCRLLLEKKKKKI